MVNKFKDIFLDFTGIFFIGFVVFSYFVSFYLGRWYEILWLCYLCLLLTGIGILIRNGFFMLAQINILFVADFFWNLDYIYHIFAGRTLLGIIDYFLIEGNYLAHLVSLQHIFFIPLSLAALYLIKSRRKDAWKLSFLEFSFIYPLTFFITPREFNVNCVFNSCINFGFFRPYILSWIFVFFGVVFIGNYVISLFKIFFVHSKPRFFKTVDFVKGIKSS